MAVFKYIYRSVKEILIANSLFLLYFKLTSKVKLLGILIWTFLCFEIIILYYYIMIKIIIAIINVSIYLI